MEVGNVGEGGEVLEFRNYRERSFEVMVIVWKEMNSFWRLVVWVFCFFISLWVEFFFC